jgi:hypothetical protein
MGADKPFRVLSLDGGGIRGIYTAAYLRSVSRMFAQKDERGMPDVGRAFDLIVGTSTGAIIACALAAAVPLDKVVRLYQENAAAIFKKPLRAGRLFGVPRLRSWFGRSQALARGTEVLRTALENTFGSITLGDVYKSRRIALAVTAVDMEQHRGWVFKTPHLPDTNHRDDDYSLVDVCLASSAAPLFRSLAVIDHVDGLDGYKVFADGGLWANNPVLVALVEALHLTEEDDRIEVFCAGTCAAPTGQNIAKDDVHRSLFKWKLGGEAAALSIDAQQTAVDNIARMLVPHLRRDCHVVRFPVGPVPAGVLRYLDLDESRPEGLAALISLARSDADATNSWCGRRDDYVGGLVSALFDDAPRTERLRHA